MHFFAAAACWVFLAGVASAAVDGSQGSADASEAAAAKPVHLQPPPPVQQADQNSYRMLYVGPGQPPEIVPPAAGNPGNAAPPASPPGGAPEGVGRPQQESASRGLTGSGEVREEEPSPENPLRYNGGYVQHQSHIYIIFWGKNWTERAGTKEKMIGLYQWINGSPFAAALSQYFDYGGPITGSVNVAASYTDTREDPQNVTEAAVKSEVAYSIEHQAWPTPNYENQYVVFTSPKATLAKGEEGYCGYHDWWGEGYKGASLALTYIPWSDPQGCWEGGATEAWQGLQITASHEWAEAATDPIIYGAYGGWNNTHWVPCPTGYKCSETIYPQIFPVCAEYSCAQGEEVADMCYGTEYEGTGIFLNRVWDDYLAKATGADCVLHDSAPVRFRVESAGGSAVAASHTIQMQGSINAAGYPGNYEFQLYRGSEQLQSTSSALSPAFGPQGVGAQSVRVKGNTTYRILMRSTSQLTTAIVNNYYGVTGSFPFSAEGSVTTPDWRPVVSTQPATGVQRFSARLNGTVNPQGEETQYFFEYGPTTSYGQSIPVPSANAGSGTEAISVSQLLTGIEESATYHFRIRATNGEGTVYGSDQTFTTSGIKPVFQSSFGSTGTGNGQFGWARGAALDAAGNLWVVDQSNNRIEEFNESGAWVRTCGSTGSGNGQLSNPRELAVAPSGNIWVTDGGNNRVEGFKPNCEFAGAWRGSGENQIYSPWGIAFDSAGNMWVGSQGTFTVDEFTESGSFIRKIGPAPTGLGAGSEPGQFYYDTHGIAAGPDGRIWVVDAGNSRVQEFNETGEFIAQFGKKGTGNGQFTSMNGIARDSQGTIWVADGEGHRVQGFTESGGYVTQFGTNGAGAGQFSVPHGIAVSPSGALFVTDANLNRVSKWSNPVFSPAYESAFGSSGSAEGKFGWARGAALDGQGNLWVVDSSNNRIEEFTEEGEFLQSCGTAGSGNGQLQNPREIAIGPSGKIWVTDAGNQRVEGFKSNCAFAGAWRGSGENQLYAPWGIAIDPKGHVWVGDQTTFTVKEFTESGSFIRKIGPAPSEFGNGSGPGQFGETYGIVASPSGKIWVVDRGNWRVQEFNEKGEFITQFGAKGTSAGKFTSMNGIARDTQGTIWVADGEGHRVEGFTENGVYVTQFGTKGSGPGQFSVPHGIAADSHGNLFVTDSNLNRVTKWLNPYYAPTYLTRWGSTGTGNGQFGWARGAALDAAGNLWVVDQSNNRIEEFNESGTWVRTCGSTGSGNGQLSNPHEIAVAPSGNIWVTDAGNQRVEGFKPNCEFAGAWRSSGENQLWSPWGIAIDSKGNVWVGDTTTFTVKEFTESGSFIRKIGPAPSEFGNGSGPGQFGETKGIAAGPNGDIWVVDVGNSRVQQFNENGEYIRQFGKKGSGNGQFKSMNGIARDSQGTIWVADGENHRVQGFTEAGEYITQFGTNGTGPAQFSVPHGIAAGPGGIMYVTDANLNRVSKWLRRK
jgi:sugar lactone lactonase YvrE